MVTGIHPENFTFAYEGGGISGNNLAEFISHMLGRENLPENLALISRQGFIELLEKASNEAGYLIHVTDPLPLLSEGYNIKT